MDTTPHHRKKNETEGLTSFKLYALDPEQPVGVDQVELVLMDQMQILCEHSTRTMALLLMQNDQPPEVPRPAILLNERAVVRAIWQLQSVLAELRLQPIASRSTLCSGLTSPTGGEDPLEDLDDGDEEEDTHA